MSVPAADSPRSEPRAAHVAASHDVVAASHDVAALVHADLLAATERVELLEQEHLDLLDDPGVIQEDRDASAMLLATARITQAAAQAAVDRIQDGSYGRCAACGREIPSERLEAVPETTHCVDCPA